MKLTQVKGNTWVIEANELIPLYKLDDRRCVLLDTGLLEEREELESTLLEAGLTPAAELRRARRGAHCVKSNMVYRSAKTWYTHYSLAIDR